MTGAIPDPYRCRERAIASTGHRKRSYDPLMNGREEGATEPLMADPVRSLTRTRDGRREAVFAVATFAGYLVAAYWAKELSLEQPVLIWFPPAGLAMAALFLRPRLLPIVASAELVSTAVVMGLASQFGPLALVVNSGAISGSYAVGAWVMRREGLDPALRSAADILRLAFGALIVASGLAALTGVGVQVWVGLAEGGEFFRQVWFFWVGDVVGITCLTPLLLIALTAWLDGDRPAVTDIEHRTNLALLVPEYLSPAVAALLLMEVVDQPMQFTYLAFVPLILIAVRHGVPGAAVAVLALGSVMIAGAHILVPEAVERSDVQLQITLMSGTVLLSGAVVSARRDVLDTAERVRDIIEASPDLVVSVDSDGVIRYLNPVGRRLLGQAAIGITEEPTDARRFLPGDLELNLVAEAVRTAQRTGTWTGETSIQLPDGHMLPVSMVLVAHRHPGDDAVTYSAVCRDMSDRIRAEDELRRAVLYDDATGLANRVLLTAHLARTVEGSTPESQVVVLFVDLDHLDRVNQTFGFRIGDRVVVQMAERLTRLTRSHELVARYGGAQFVVVMPEVTDDYQAVVLASRILEAFADPIEAGDHSIQVAGSVGIAVADPAKGHHHVLRSAEIALHRAKEAGGGRFAIFDADLQYRSEQRLDMEEHLRGVLSRQAWWLEYQPILETGTDRITGAEALLRWTHPEHGPVPPFELIRLAEESGSIVQLGEEIIRRACEEAKTWHEHGHDLAVSINVSARQLREAGFADDISRIIHDVGIAPDKVVFELTETVLATNHHGEGASLQRLRDLGCLVAMDDFGTGYSSLSSLRELPIDVVKLDRSFVVDLAEAPDASSMVSAVVELTETLGLLLVAEGVDHPSQVQMLAELGCPRYQGFVFSEAIRPEALTALLDGRSSNPTRTHHPDENGATDDR